MRLRCLISFASSMPLMPGIRMSSTMTRELVAHERQQRLVGRRARAPAVHSSIVEHHLEHVEVPRLVVDDQDLDGVRHADRSSESASCSAVQPDAQQRQQLVGVTGLAM